MSATVLFAFAPPALPTTVASAATGRAPLPRRRRPPARLLVIAGAQSGSNPASTSKIAPSAPRTASNDPGSSTAPRPRPRPGRATGTTDRRASRFDPAAFTRALVGLLGDALALAQQVRRDPR